MCINKKQICQCRPCNVQIMILLFQQFLECEVIAGTKSQTEEVMAGMKSMARRVRLLLDEGGLQNCLLAMQLLLARRARHMGLLLAERFWHEVGYC
jgi:hypothetical protein